MDCLVENIKRAIPDADIDFSNATWDGIKSNKIYGLVCNKHPNPRRPWQPVYNNIIRLHSGCPECANDANSIRQLEKFDFIGKSKAKHGPDRFDYSKTIYRGLIKNVTLKCLIHNEEFTCTATEHLKSKGGCCPECRRYNTSGENHHSSVSLEELKDRIHSIWGDRFQYDFTGYRCLRDDILITCSVCNRTWAATATNHVHPTDPRGCIICGRKETGDSLRLSLDEFISKSNAIHDGKYDYTKFVYVNNSTEGLVTCRIHGDYSIRPAYHFRGTGCGLCSSGGISIGETQWLNYQATTSGRIIVYKGGSNSKQEWFRFNGKLYRVDGYCRETRTIYEFLGCWHHGCNKCGRFNPDAIHPWQQQTYRELFDKFQRRKKTFEENGYNMIYIWECEWDIQKKQVNISAIPNQS